MSKPTLLIAIITLASILSFTHCEDLLQQQIEFSLTNNQANFQLPQGILNFTVSGFSTPGSSPSCIYIRANSEPTTQYWDYSSCSGSIPYVTILNDQLLYTDDLCSTVTWYILYVPTNDNSFMTVNLYWDGGCDGCGGVNDTCGVCDGPYHCPVSGGPYPPEGTYNGYDRVDLDRFLLNWAITGDLVKISELLLLLNSIQVELQNGGSTTGANFNEIFYYLNQYQGEIAGVTQTATNLQSLLA